MTSFSFSAGLSSASEAHAELDVDETELVALASERTCGTGEASRAGTR